MRFFAIPLFAFLILQATAQQKPYDSDDENWNQVCIEAKSKPITPPHLTGPLSSTDLPKCNERALYYGFDTAPNYPAALQCGWYEQQHPQSTVGNVFYGEGVLTMLYANGLGVTRNYDLAIQFACNDGWAAEAEMIGRIAHLKHLLTTRAQTKDFDLCDDITSGLSMGFCTSISTDKANAVRNRKIAETTSSLSSAAKALFPALQKAETAFEESRARNEIDLSGTARGMFVLEEEAKLRDQFLINLRRFGKSDIPLSSAPDVASLDAQLNLSYQKIQRSPASDWKDGTVNPEGIRDTERTWLPLVDTWLRFAQAAYPTLSPARIRAQLIRLRLHQLKSLRT